MILVLALSLQVPVVVGNYPGFVGNRMAVKLKLEVCFETQYQTVLSD